MVRKFFAWMKESNRWKHLLLGVGIGLASDDVCCAALSGLSAAGGMEIKDVQWGGKFDWTDLGVTMAGVATEYAIRVSVWGK